MNFTTFIPDTHLNRAEVIEHQIVQPSADPSPAIWAQVEIMGHRVRVGQVREVARFGRTMVEITRPALPAMPAYQEPSSAWRSDVCRTVNGLDHWGETPAIPAEVEWYSPDSLFCVKEITESDAMEILKRSRPKGASTFVPDEAGRAAIEAVQNRQYAIDPLFLEDDD